jgi:prepilin-type N-terminal cleavage/methylation domain-containing protein
MILYPGGHRGRSKGFSLVELLVVVAVMAVMASVLLPAIAGFSSTAGRKGAVNILMNTFEQARVAALESGQTVYVGFADADIPAQVQDMQYAAFLVFRDATDEEKSADAKRKFVVLKKWTRLPRNVSFKRVDSSLVPMTTAGSKIQDISYLKNELGSAFSSWTGNCPVVAFNSSGAVEQPASNLCLYLYDGYFSGGKENYTRNNATQNSSAGLFEKISISRYTGRAQLDITGS